MKDLLKHQIVKHKRPIKYLIAGGTAAFTDLSLLYIATDILGIWYLFSACLAFVVAFFVSFFLQKFWTFRDNDQEQIYKQLGAYLAVALANFTLNAALMYIFVDGLRIWYMLAQFMISGLIACESYFVYKLLIFNRENRSVKGKLKIVIATGIYPPDIGGPAQYAKNLAEQLENQGHQIEVLSYRMEKKLPIGIRHILYFFRVIWNLNKVNLIIAFDTFSVGVPAALAAIIFNKKIIIRTGGDFLWESYVERSGNLVTLRQFYDIKPVLNLKEKIVFILSRYILRKSAAVVFSTAWQKEIFEKYYGLNSRRNYIVANYFAAEKPGEETVRAKRFLWAGRPIRLKNLERLKQAFNQARKIRPELSLNIIQGRPYEKLLEEIKGSYAVILPSLSEISPNFILDAIGCGRPFIMTEESGYYEMFKSIGIFIDPLDEEDIKNKILFLADDKNYLEYKDKVKNFSYKHTWSEIAGEFMNIYKNL